MTTLDTRDAEIWLYRVAKRDAIAGPRIGDFAIMKDGRTMRFSYDWIDALQVSIDGRFYLHRSGELDFSGGLEPAIPKNCFVETSETREGSAWFFHHDEARAHNDVIVKVPCRVYREGAA